MVDGCMSRLLLDRLWDAHPDCRSHWLTIVQLTAGEPQLAREIAEELLARVPAEKETEDE